MSSTLSAYVNAALSQAAKKKKQATSVSNASVNILSFREALTGEKDPAPAVLPPINALPAVPLPAPATEAPVVPSSEEGSWALVVKGGKAAKRV